LNEKNNDKERQMITYIYMKLKTSSGAVFSITLELYIKEDPRFTCS